MGMFQPFRWTSTVIMRVTAPPCKSFSIAYFSTTSGYHCRQGWFSKCLVGGFPERYQLVFAPSWLWRNTLRKTITRGCDNSHDYCTVPQLRLLLHLLSFVVRCFTGASATSRILRLLSTR